MTQNSETDKKRKSSRQWIWIILIVVLIVPQSRRFIISSVYRLFASPPNIESAGKISDTEWNWQIEDEQGEILLFSKFQDKVIFLNFWATWCPNCIAEFNDIDEIYRKYGEKVVFVLVSNEDREQLKRFKERKGYSFPIYKARREIPLLFSHKVIPTTFLINKLGNVTIKETGTVDWTSPEFTSHIEDLIRK